MKGNIANLLIEDGKAHFAEHKMLDNPPNGPGDLTSALILSHLLSGADPLKALQLTTSSVFEIVAGAAKRQANELMLETDAQSISRPMSMVQMRTIALVDSSASTAKRPAVFKPTSL